MTRYTGRFAALFVAAGLVWGAACDDGSDSDAPPDRKPSRPSSETDETEDPPSPPTEPEPLGEERREAFYEPIAKTVCPEERLSPDTNEGDAVCIRCPEWTWEGKRDSDERATLDIHVGRFTPEAAGTGDLEASVNLATCARRASLYDHGAFLERRGGDWELVRHSAKIDLSDCRRVVVADGGRLRTTLHCSVGGTIHQGVMHAMHVSYLLDSESWRRQNLAALYDNAGSGMSEQCRTVRPSLESVDDSDPTSTELAIRIRSRVRPRTGDNFSCADGDAATWDDDGVVRYLWNGEAFEVTGEDRVFLERSVARSKIGEFDFDAYLEPETVEGAWEDL